MLVKFACLGHHARPRNVNKSLKELYSYEIMHHIVFCEKSLRYPEPSFPTLRHIRPSHRESAQINRNSNVLDFRLLSKSAHSIALIIEVTRA